MPPLVRLPREILNGVFQGVDPEDLANLSKTCQVLNIFIKYDRLLWKDVYLRNYVCHWKHFSLHWLIITGLSILETGAARARMAIGTTEPHSPQETASLHRQRCQGKLYRHPKIADSYPIDRGNTYPK